MKRRAAAMSGCAEGPVPATTGASRARSSATRIHHRKGEPMTRTGASGVRRPSPPAGPGGARRAVGAVRAVLQPAVAVRGERYRGGRRDLQALGEIAHQAVEVGGRFLGDRHGGAERGSGAGDDGGDQRRQQQGDHRERADGPAGARSSRCPCRSGRSRRRRAAPRPRPRAAAQRPAPCRGSAAPRGRGHAPPGRLFPDLPRACTPPAVLMETDGENDGENTGRNCAVRASCRNGRADAGVRRDRCSLLTTVAPATDIAMPVSHLPDAAAATVPDARHGVRRALARHPSWGCALSSAGYLVSVTRWNGFG